MNRTTQLHFPALLACGCAVQLLHSAAVLPEYGTEGAAGFDLVMIQDVTIRPGEKILVPTGLAFRVPTGLELQIRPRSGTSLKTDLRVVNSPGTIDSDYRGEVGLIFELPVTAPAPMKLIKGMAYAQGVLAPYVKASFFAVPALDATARGAGGYGSTDAVTSPQ